MSDLVNPPELIISLSRDKVRLVLTDQAGQANSTWTSTFPVEGLFLEEQLSAAMDTALLENPSLLEHFHEVSIVLVDRPNICVPKRYAVDNSLTDIAGRYLRIGPGDTLTTDTVSGDQAIAYAIPSSMINVFREYYASAGPLHMTSLLWNAIHDLVQPCEKDNSRLFFYTTGNTLIVIGQTASKLSFSKSFYIQERGDLSYYAMACSKMLRPKEKWLLTMMEESMLFDFQGTPHFSMDHQLELPAFHDLIARHGSCES
jgi:hypothetical protein